MLFHKINSTIKNMKDMKNYLYLAMAAFMSIVSFASCNNDNDLKENSIFTESVRVENAFDVWLKKNYTDNYNIKVIYRLEDMETDLEHTLAPADFELSQTLSKIVKYAWLEAYDEVAGVDFTRTYVPKIIHLIGSAAYESNGTMILGTAEGGLKVTLYLVNSLQINEAFLNEYYFKTMHHEFTHILNQTKNYDTDFERISEGNYVSGDWYLVSETTALQSGFITPYSMSEAGEDYAEMVAMYVITDPQVWASKMVTAGTDGAAIIGQKLDMVKTYMSEQWNIDLDELRSIIQRRMQDVVNGTLDIEPVVKMEELAN